MALITCPECGEKVSDKSISYCLFTCLIHTPVKEYARLYILCAGIFSILVPAFMLSMWHYIRYQAQEINRLHNIIDKLLNIH